MAVYRKMPATQDPAFSAGFYQRWGRESAVISARTLRAEYPAFRQLLSIKAAFGGSESYFVDGRRICVDDDTFTILNHDRSYASAIDSLTPVHSFSIFFDTRLAAEARQSLLRSQESSLEPPAFANARPIEFQEKLYAHDQLVSPVLRHIRDALDAGLNDEAWLDEQYLFLLGRMVQLHYNRVSVEQTVPSGKPSTRRELLRRLEYGVDYIHARYADPIRLGDIAAAAHMSAFHFLRTFKAVYHVTPIQFLNRKRAAAARRLLENSAWSMSKIAAQVGLGSRTSLFRLVHAEYGQSPRALRSGVRAGPDDSA